MNLHHKQALNAYRQVGLDGQIASVEASPHAVVRMLFDGALEKIALARNAMTRQDLVSKAQAIPNAIRIIDGLRVHLDHERGGDLANNLEELYDYMSRRLIDANVSNDVRVLDEVSSLLVEVRSGWDAIAPESARGNVR